MITFMVLLALAIVAAVIAFAFDVAFIVWYGDLIICGLIIALLVKLFRRRK